MGMIIGIAGIVASLIALSVNNDLGMIVGMMATWTGFLTIKLEDIERKIR